MRLGAWVGALTAALAICGGSVPGAGAARLEGVDVSRFQHRIDWGLVAGDGIAFAFVQASRGTGNDCSVKPRRCGPDELYDFNYDAARAAGIAVGPYHRAFASGRGRDGVKADAKAEAGVFITSVGATATGRPRPRARRRDAVRGPQPRQAAPLGAHLAEAGRAQARRPADHLHEHELLVGDRRHHRVRARRPSALGRPVGRSQAERPGRRLGRRELVGVAVHEFGLGRRDRGQGRPRPSGAAGSGRSAPPERRVRRRSGRA